MLLLYVIVIDNDYEMIPLEKNELSVIVLNKGMQI